MSSNGYQMGGVVGFLKTLSRIVSETKPKAVYVAWEGGGSQRRRKLYPDYKKNRKAPKLNRFYEDDIPESEENKKHQIMVLLEALKSAPVCQLYVSDCEGDDIIAYLCKGPLSHESKVLVSSDKDMYQLLDDKTTQYSLHKKTFVTKENVYDDFRVTTENFALAKALCGDPSDNIPGVKGLGFKKVAKLYPILGGQKVMIQDVIDYSHSHLDESRLYQRVIDSENDFRRNWKLVHLGDSMISASQTSKLDHVVSTFQPSVRKVELMKLMVKEGVDFDVDSFLFAFNCINGLTYGG